MMRSSQAASHTQQQGVISLLVLLVLMAGVIGVQMQAFQISTSNSLGAQQYQDNLAALYLAESGLERARGSLTLAGVNNPADFQSTCNSYVSGGTFALGRGSFQYLDPLQPSTPTFCPFRVVGIVGTARRTLQTSMGFAPSSGQVGFDSNIAMGVANPHGVASVGLFNLAWRRHGSTGHSTSGGSASGNNCGLPGCVPVWNIESSSGSPSVGSMGTAVPVAANGIGQITHTLSAARNFAGVGINLPGLIGPPVVTGSFADDKRTANTKNNTVTKGDTSSGEANNWCRASDTLVLGISGRSDDDVTATFTSVVFNTNDNPAQPQAMTRIVHAPNTDGSTPNAFGDVFSEIWYSYNPYVFAANASSSGTTVTVPSPISIAAGTLLKVYSGTGAFAGNTRVVSSVTNVTQFQVDSTPTTALNNATICGGICALFHNPASSSSKTEFTVTRNEGAEKEWAGGFTCLAGVNPAQISTVIDSSVKLNAWREVVTHE